MIFFHKQKKEKEQKIIKNEIDILIINSDMTDFQSNIKIYQSSVEIGFRLYKLDKYYLRIVLRKKIYDLYFDSSFGLNKSEANKNLTNFELFAHLFSYSNNYVISLRTSSLIQYLIPLHTSFSVQLR